MVFLEYSLSYSLLGNNSITEIHQIQIGTGFEGCIGTSGEIRPVLGNSVVLTIRTPVIVARARLEGARYMASVLERVHDVPGVLYGPNQAHVEFRCTGIVKVTREAVGAVLAKSQVRKTTYRHTTIKYDGVDVKM